jgi:pimeloyl-ACP methyl ester carboxylesterase
MTDIWFTSPDGLRLYARDSGTSSTLTPVLCLSGLTRNSKDFAPIFDRHAASRRIIAMDYRGRGRSQYADWQTYRPDVELTDAIALLDHLAIPRLAVIGTSRGGLIAMVMAAQHKHRMAGVLLNDVGPVLDVAGLLRIRGYLGKTPPMQSWDDAVAALKRTNLGFESLTPDEWLHYTRTVFRDQDGRPAMDYDPELARSFPLAKVLSSKKLPALWNLFDLLTDLPVSVLRGEHSDLLSAATYAEMADHHPTLDATTVKDRGHVPFLTEPESVAAIDRWLRKIDQAR